MSNNYDQDDIFFDERDWRAAHNPGYMDLSEDDYDPDLMDPIQDHNPDYADYADETDDTDDTDDEDPNQDSGVPDSYDHPDSDAEASVPDSSNSALSPSSSSSLSPSSYASPPHNPNPVIDDSPDLDSSDSSDSAPSSSSSSSFSSSSSPSPRRNPDDAFGSSPDFAQRQTLYAPARAHPHPHQHPQEEASDLLEDSEEEPARPQESSPAYSLASSHHRDSPPDAPDRPWDFGGEVTESDEEHAHVRAHTHRGRADDIYFAPQAALAGSVGNHHLLDDDDGNNQRAIRASTVPLPGFDQDLFSITTSSDDDAPSPSDSPSSQYPPESGSGSDSDRQRQPGPRHDASSPSLRRARASLTPTIHPNRRLPRNPDPSQDPHLLSDDSDSSSDELLVFHERPRPRALQHQLRHVPDVELIPLSEDEDEVEETAVEEEEGPGRSSGSEQSRDFSNTPESLQLEDLDDQDDSGTDAQRQFQDHIQQLQQLQGLQARRDRLQARRTGRVDREARLQRGQTVRRTPLFVNWDDPEVQTDMDDELVEVVFDRQVNARPNQPQQQLQRRQRAQRHLHQHHHHQQQAAGVPDVIDLTAEPDSPILQSHHPVRAPRLHNDQVHDSEDREAVQRVLYRRARNPRRQMAQNGRTPSLARSDGTNLGIRHDVIDLTSDGPEDDLDFNDGGLQGIPAHRRLPVPVRAPVPPPPRNHRANAGLIALGRGLLSLGARQLGDLLQYNQVQDALAGGQPLNNMDANPLAANMPVFNYQNNGFGAGGRQPTPKPDYVPPPPARSGFTRNTGPDPETGEEMLVVCASCDNELKYSDDKDDDGPRPAKKARTKKDREEHYFWAVKACGHVYCKRCYDERKKTGKQDYLGFGLDDSGKTKIFCAVDDCESDVTSTNAWVGIFM